MFDREDTIWAAGFHVGEGSTSCTSSTNGQSDKRYRKISMSASQKHREPLDRMAATLGGKVYGPYPRQGAPYQWRLNGLEKVQAAVAAMWPWLDGMKREQARLALADIHA